LKPLLAALLLCAPAAQAEDWGLIAETPQCGALEALVVWGVIDGGDGGDTSALTAVVRADDPAVCQSWLNEYAFPQLFNRDDDTDPGLDDPVCAQAFMVLSTNGLPASLAGQEGEYLIQLLAPRASDTCDNILFDLTAGR